MIRYVLDTNVLVDVLRNRPKGVRERLLEIGIDKCVVSDLTVFELYSGVASFRTMFTYSLTLTLLSSAAVFTRASVVSSKRKPVCTLLVFCANIILQ